MNNTLRHFTCVLAILPALAAPLAATADDDYGRTYEVTITNLTRGQQFTPVLIVGHREGLRLFELGEPASPELRILAEEGNTGPLAAALSLRPETSGLVTGNSLTDPGMSTRLVLTASAGRKFDRFSLAAMLIPTNDAFLAVNGVELPKGKDSLVVMVPAYDAGTERNDETCASIPGPFFVECGGSGGGARVGGGEGYVHIHAGMHGIGDMNASQRDWRNPVARITVRRMR